MRKMIILIISIVITLVGTALIGVYDYNVWYNPEGKNATQLQADYKSYLVEKTVEIKDKTNLEKTESRIKLYRQLENYLYSEEPIYTETKMHNGVELFKIAVYKNVFWKVNSSNEKELDHYRYEVFIYNVNYVEIKNMFKEMRVPEDPTIIDKANDPKFVVNFYPYAKNDGAYNVDEALINDSTYNSTYITSLYDGEELIGYTMGNSSTLNLFDYGSNPQKNKNDEVYYVRSFVFYDYTFTENVKLFEGGFIKVDALLETTQSGTTYNYKLDESLIDAEIKGFTFNRDEIKESDYVQGFATDQGSRALLNSVDLDGVLSYDGWVFTRYLWWQCLIAFIACGLLMTGSILLLHMKKKELQR